jgi:hypothetical protein
MQPCMGKENGPCSRGATWDFMLTVDFTHTTVPHVLKRLTFISPFANKAQFIQTGGPRAWHSADIVVLKLWDYWQHRTLPGIRITDPDTVYDTRVNMWPVTVKPGWCWQQCFWEKLRKLGDIF